ncbi:class I glutamine amidotransferase-like protein [Schizophyllum amplum]|uniref:Class I glutamine amidotransferase-like protein n=1 Tax=Schizophyllum amplum TaxID=97359 RepID=A0A550CNZ0_9AGAR|nr:class I glutamine amidotransferase-like protein [Auriculariopsis ampla]
MAPRLALLKCATPIPSVQRENGDYLQMFRELLRNALPRPDLDFQLDGFDVVHNMEYPLADTMDVYSGVLISGSAASAYDDKEWINKLVGWVKWLAEAKPNIKIFGICFGHQIVARALGGTCEPNGQWEVGPTVVSLTDAGKAVFGKDSLYLQQMHRDHVPDVVPGFELLGSTPICRNHGMVKYADADPHSIHILTMQGHPEFTAQIVDKIIDARVQGGILDARTAQDYATRRAWTNDGVTVVGRTIWKSLGVEAA